MSDDLLPDVLEWDEEEPLCGEAYDHDLEVVYEDEEVTQAVCRNCGGELWWDTDE